MSVWLFVIASLLCLVGAATLFISGRKNRKQMAIMQRFNTEVGAMHSSALDLPQVSRSLTVPNGISNFFINHQILQKLVLIVLPVGIVSWYLWGYINAIFITVIVLMLFQVWWSYKQNKRRHSIVSQIPLFIDQLIRSLATGQSVEAGFRLVALTTPAPLGEIFGRVIKSTNLGAALTESLLHEAEMAQVNELRIVALSIKISTKFGSSPREMLESVMHMIYNQEQARRELQAMTGETKISALVLISVPVVILLYTMIMNPGYIEMMTSDDTGIVIFRTAIAMQVFGAFLFWRMMKSI